MNRTPNNTWTTLFRIALAGALITTTWLCTSPVETTTPPMVNDKVAHLATFLILAFLADFSFPASGFTARKYLPLFLYGVLIEVIQSFLPTRSFSLLDMVADALGLLLYLPLSHLLPRIPGISRLRSSHTP